MKLAQVLALLCCVAAATVAASSRRALPKDRAADVISEVSLDRPHTQRLLRRQLQELEQRLDRRPPGRDQRRYALGAFGGLGGGAGLGGGTLGGGGLGGGFGPLVLSPSLIDTSSLGATGHQPRAPVYHATPLQPFGSLLATRPHVAATEEPKPIEEEQVEDSEPPQPAPPPPPPSHGHGQPPSAASYQNAEYKIVEPAYRHQLHGHGDEDDGHGQYAAKYQFGYQVRDPKSGSYFGHTESRSGHLTKGHYHVLLPDGRLQNVQYWADPSGYHAQVSFKGVAKHPPPANNHNHNHELAPTQTLLHPGYGYGALKRVSVEQREAEAEAEVEGDQS